MAHAKPLVAGGGAPAARRAAARGQRLPLRAKATKTDTLVGVGSSSGGRAPTPRSRAPAARSRRAPMTTCASLAGEEKVVGGSDWRDSDKEWTVWKFGGTCVAGPERLTRVAELLRAEVAKGKRLAVVLSAMGSTPEEPVKVTDQLLRAVSNAKNRNEEYRSDLAKLEELHIKAAMQLLGDDTSGLFEEYEAMIREDVKNLKSMLKAVTIVGVSSSAFSDFVVGHGELWNARLFTAYLKITGSANAKMVDARWVPPLSPPLSLSSFFPCLTLCAALLGFARLDPASVFVNETKGTFWWWSRATRTRWRWTTRTAWRTSTGGTRRTPREEISRKTSPSSSPASSPSAGTAEPQL